MVYGFGQVVNLISPLLITPYLIYICGLEKLGVIAIGQSFAYILIVLVDYSSYIIGVKEISLSRNEPHKLQKLFTTIYAAKTILLIGVIAFGMLLILLVPYFNRYILSMTLSLSIVVGQYVNPTWFFQGVENFKWITIINILGKALYVVGVLLFVKAEQDYIFANLFLGAGAILAHFIGFLFILNKYRFKLNEFSLIAVKQLLARDFSFCVSQLFFAVRNYSAVIIIGFFAGDYVAGKFKVIEQIVNLVRTYLQMFFKFTYSYVCFEIDTNLANGIKLWKKYNGLNLILLLGIIVILFFASDYIFQFFKVDPRLFAEFKVYLHIALFIPLLIGFTLPLEQLIFSLNKNREYIFLTMASTIFNIVMLSLIMTFFGLKQAFALLVFTEAMLIIFYYILLKSYFLKPVVVHNEN